MRWKAIIPGTIFLAAVMVFCFVFLDPLAEKTLECLGSKIAGAKVDIASVDIGLRRSQVVIRGLQVADKEDPWTNLFEFHRLAFNYAVEPLFTKKFLIQEMAAEGLRWGTKRKTSGELPKRQKPRKQGPSMFEKLAKEVELPQVDLDKIKNLDWKSQVTPENLQSLRLIEDTKTQSQNLKSGWTSKIDGLQIQPTVDSVKASVESAKNLKISGPQDIPQAQKTIQDLKTSQETLQKKLGEVQSLKDGLDKDMGQVQKTLQSVDKTKDQDVQGLLSKLKLPDFSAKGIARAVFGPVWLGRLDKVMGYVETARRYMPSGKDKEKIQEEPPPRRREGLSITFPGRRPLPKFLIEKILVSGSTEKVEAEKNAMDFSGQITGITSDPAVYGKPLKLDLKGGRHDRTNFSAALLATLDHTGEISQDEFLLQATGIDISGQKWKVPEYLPSSIEQGTLAADLKFRMVGPELEASLGAKTQSLKLAGAGSPRNDVERIIQTALSNAQALSLEAQAAGTPQNLDFSISTDLDNFLSSQLKSLVGEEIAKLKGQIQASVNELVDRQKAEAQKLVDTQQKEIFDQLAQKTGPLTEQQNQLAALTKRLEDEIKQKAGTALPKSIPGDLKRIFK